MDDKTGVGIEDFLKAGTASYFQTIFDNVPTGLVIIDPGSHRIVDANDAAVRMIGTDKANIIGEICHSFICPAEIGRCPVTDLRRIVDHADCILLQSDGNKLPIIKSVRFMAADGRLYLLENFFNISEQECFKRGSEEKQELREIFDQTFQFIGLMTPEGTLIYANRTALAFGGISEPDVIGKPFWDTPWWAHSEKLQQELHEGIQTAASGNFIRFEASHRAADGSLHFIDFSLKPVYNEAGQVQYLISEGRDITDRKKAEDELQKKNFDLSSAYERLIATEEELRQNYSDLLNTDKELVDRENKIRAMFEQTFQFIDLLTTEGILVNTNRPLSAFGAASIPDLAKIPYPDTKLWSYSHNLSRKMKYAVLSAARGEFTRFEILDTSDDGSPRYTDFSIKPVKDRNGKALYLIAECRDITDLKTTSQALVESENLYRAIFGNTGTAMALLEEDMTLSLVNAEFEHLCGFSKCEIEGNMNWTRFIDTEDLNRMQEEFAARKTGDIPATPTQSEFRFITKTGDVRNVFMTMDNIPETKKSVSSLMDITDRNQMTRKLSAALDEKEVLLREIHHRVKNNLQIIISLLNLQSHSFSDEKVLSAIMESQNRVRAMALVHEKIYQSESLSEIDITEYIRYLGTYLFQFYNVDMNTIRLIIKGGNIRIGINTAVPLGLIINELISNSLKHAFPGGRSGEIQVRLETTDSDIELFVSDNGIGFTKDYDWEKSDTLGLMLVQSLIRQILASVEMDGAAGTQYRIKIPLKKVESIHS